MAVVLTIPGRPVPAVRMTQGEAKLMRYGRPRSEALQKKYDRIKRYLDYKDAIGIIGRTKFKEPLKGKAQVQIGVYVSSGVVGDWDNYGKAACDGLNKIAWKDDRQVKDGRVVIYQCPDGVERMEITIQEVG